MNKVKTTLQSEEDEILGLHETFVTFLGYTQYTKTSQHIVVDLDEEIQSAKYYRHVCNKLIELGEQDTVDINICSSQHRPLVSASSHTYI
jgi:hypothetical protein